MKALVYRGPGRKSWEEVPDPVLVADTDAIVRVDATTICGSNLHILKGDLPEVTDGRVLGHEAVGTVMSIGSGVKTVRVGDRVLVSCITSCGTCRFRSHRQHRRARQARHAHLEMLWTRDVTITTGLVDAFTTPTLLRLVSGGQLPADLFVTHRFPFDQFEDAYDVFARAPDTGALKVVLAPP